MNGTQPCSECQNRKDGSVRDPDGLILIETGDRERFGQILGNWSQTDVYECSSCNRRWEHTRQLVGANFDLASKLEPIN